MSPLEVAIEREWSELFEFFIDCGAQLILEDSHLPGETGEHKSLSERVTSKGGRSIITQYLLTAFCTGSTELLGVLRKRVYQNVLGKSWIAALVMALRRCDESMLAFLLQTEIPQEDLYDSWPLILQEAIDYFHKKTIPFVYQITTKFGIPDRWLPYAAGALPTEIIRQLFPRIFDSGSLFQQTTLEGKSCLEMAMLNHHSGVAQFFLQLLPGEYDSGALCASVLRAARLSDFGPVHELLNRRISAVGKRDAVLENTAISIAGYFNLINILVPLLEYSYPTDLSLAPEGPDDVVCDDGHSDCIIGPLAIRYVWAWTAWRTLPPSSLRSPLLLATANINNSNQEYIIELMVEKGYQCDTPHLWTEIALKCSGSILISLVGEYDNANSWISYDNDWIPYDNDVWCDETVCTESRLCPTALHRAIHDVRLEMARLLIDQGADVNKRKPEGTMDEIFPEYSSCLQIAARSLDNDEEKVEAIIILLRAGADLNAPACWYRGATALQFVVMNGDLSLARRLINHGANINAPRGIFDGRTCLEGAAEHGKLDMVQYLLNAGADTEGTGRVQYIYATVLAEARGYWAIVETLQTHRKWDSTDEALFEELRVAKKKWATIIIVHPEEHPAEEFAMVRSWCRDHEEDFSKNDVYDGSGQPFLVWPDLGHLEGEESKYPGHYRELGALPTLAHLIIPERDRRLDELAKPIILDVSEVCDHVVDLVGEDEARPSYFRKEATADAHALHDALYDITLDAEEAVRYEYHGEGWNNFISAPLLKLVYPRPKRPRPAMGATATAQRRAARERHVHDDLGGLPSTLLVEAVGHAWQPYFACNRGPAIDVYGPLGIGWTGNITDAYVLVASLEAIKDWVETAFYAGVET
ncbi:hypothetical protein EKO27_g9257 [Xylaria grammica]|uniref:PD-(D/E)XK nuclease-like domain-containing protein n=1 Tax=Xylaria grammica TaxID=363999 RepID=A0A439CUK3_9PEZI|nr:hypothetical protein EKO27_g9257 [Xylaria grammica]